MATNPEVLNSWKEIAAYLGRGVRTVQRWERELNLPVRRPRGKSRSAVIAFKAELDRWLHQAHADGDSAKAERPLTLALAGMNGKLHLSTTVLVGQTNQLLSRSTHLCERSKQLCEQINRAVALTANFLARNRNVSGPGILSALRKDRAIAS